MTTFEWIILTDYIFDSCQIGKCYYQDPWLKLNFNLWLVLAAVKTHFTRIQTNLVEKRKGEHFRLSIWLCSKMWKSCFEESGTFRCSMRWIWRFCASSTSPFRKTIWTWITTRFFFCFICYFFHSFVDVFSYHISFIALNGAG